MPRKARVVTVGRVSYAAGADRPAPRGTSARGWRARPWRASTRFA